MATAQNRYIQIVICSAKASCRVIISLAEKLRFTEHHESHGSQEVEQTTDTNEMFPITI